MIDETKVIRCQFGAWDYQLHPECKNPEYLEYESLDYNNLHEIITFGYKLCGPGTHYRWMKLSEVLPTDMKRIKESNGPYA